ncbi:MAG: sulfatase-like hydrolase/transferase [Actinomycetota bacterium]|nr:sulfatase-like hydrolase/transferase [Actinomycetota bacterium]
MSSQTSKGRIRPAIALAIVFVLAAAVVVAIAARERSSSRTSTGGATSERTAKPNLLFILTDDQRWDTMDVMPNTRRLFNVNFDQAIVTTPLCCPSRSSFLTGRYASNTRVLTNLDYPAFKASEPDSLGPWLQANGYYTGFVGKYFNHYTVNDPVPPGWDEFYARVWGARGLDISNRTRRYLRGKWVDGSTPRNRILVYPNAADPRTPYWTTIFSDLAVRFIRRAADERYNPEQKPWALFVWPNAPNITLAEPKFLRRPVPPWNVPPSFAEDDMSDKPAEVRFGPNRAYSPGFHRVKRAKQYRVLRSVDAMVGRLFRTLDETKMRSRTRAIYSSDNGRLYGEHGLSKKLYGYEEGVRIPLFMFVPGTERTTIPHQVANIDVAPTLLELAGDRSDHAVDGRSLLPLITGRLVKWRKAVLLQNWAHLRYEGVRTERWKLIRWTESGHLELYDLERDPYELENLSERRASTLASMLQLLMRLNRRSREPAA